MTGRTLAEAAERLVGTPFRLHGRDPANGLDCVGLIGAALAAIGRPVRLPNGYRLRTTGVGHLLEQAEFAGFVETSGVPRPGGVLLMRPGPVQHHLGIAGTRGGFVHAHAGLRRVVLSPALPWPVERQWRLVTE